MMKKYYLLLICLFFAHCLLAQTTETFETETNGSTSFTDNGQVFNITSQAQGPFYIQGNYAGTGWNGSGPDNKYIDNSGNSFANMPVQFTITAAGGSQFTLKSLYLFISTNNLNLNVNGNSVSITGKLAGATQYTATASSGFNTSWATNNGFTYINMANYGGADNSNTLIDQYIITTTGIISYISLDAMRWQTAAAPCPAVTVTPVSQTNIACNGAYTGAATVSASGGSGFTYNWSPGNPSGDGTASVTGLPAGTWTVTVTNSCGNSGTASVTITQPAALSANITSQTNIACNGGTNGSATVSATGGTAGYTYVWSPSGGTAATASGLSAGTYTVTVTDANGCTATSTATITQPAALSANITSQTNIACNGGTNGSATVSATGGTVGYTYSWSPSGGTAATASGLSAGTYTVIVTDANGCIATSTATITQPAALSANITSQTNIACNGGTNGSATVSATGGTGAYTYSWSPSGGTAATASGLSAGTYTVTVTDANGCTATSTATITQPAALSANITSQTNIACNGGTNGSATVTTSGGTPGYTYSWSPSGGTAATASGLSAGTYTVTVTDANGCIATSTATITQPAALSANITSQTNIACNGGTNGSATVSATGGTGAYSYAWSPSGGTAATATGLTAGAYSVLITDVKGCTLTKNITITQPAAITATTSQTNIACNGGSNGSATVIATGGTGAYSYAWSPSGGTAATATGLSAGAYSVLITDANGCTLTKNVTITQPAALAATTSQVNPTCGPTGQAGVTVSGGTGAYTYAWSPSGGTGAIATGLSGGNYSVLITDANGCTLTKNFTLNATSNLAATTSQTNISCNGGTNGSATVTPNGGVLPYTYAWSPSGGTGAMATGLSAGTYTVTVTDANGCTATSTATITQPSVLSATSSQTNISCNGGSNGSATVTATGGTGAYSYAWSPSGGTAATATGLTAGAYSVLITDANGCTITKNVTITHPAAITATTSQTNISCNGGTNGSATVTATGGTGAYTYAWSPSGGTAATATGLSAGAYSVLITDANGCTITKNITITQPAAITATTSQTNISCNGGTNGSATVTATGGTGAYTYAWSPSGGTAATATGLSAGAYSVLITDANGCTLTKNVTITQPAAITIGMTKTSVVCNGEGNGTATANAAGGTGPYTYSWSPAGGTAATATGLAAGVYTVFVTDANGCTATRNVTIVQPTALTATTSQVNILCNEGTTGAATVTATGGTGAYTYAWSPSGGTSATANGLVAGTYSVVVTDANGCTVTQSVTITQTSAITATTSKTNVSCNGGSNGSATVVAAGGAGDYTYLWSPSGGTAATATGLASGTYTVTITDANGCSITRNVSITQPTALTATTSQINISCNGGFNGSATITATGGTGAYTYLWSPSGGTAATATGLVAGTYSVLITDVNGCTLTKNVTITQPAVLAATTSQVNILCNGGSNGSTTVTATGGTGAYTYVWSPLGGTAATATGLSAGAYSVLITDANGCTLTKNVTITQPTAITATTSQTNISCNGGSNGSANVTANGGTGTYTYAWSPSGGTAATATGLVAGAYSVLITDVNGCTLTKNVTITQPAVLAANTSQINTSCNGGSNGSATVTTTGGTGAYTYLWSPSGGTATTATGLVAGAYSVLITDANGCTITQTVTITQPDALAATTTQINVGCNAGSNGEATVNVTGGSGAYTYEWLPSGGTAATATGLVAGTYTVTVTDANGCELAQSFTITEPLAIVINSQPADIDAETGDTVVFTVNADNAGTYQWQVSTNGTDWTDVTNGGTGPEFSGATTGSLIVTGVPVSYDGYLFRVLLANGTNCITESATAMLMVTNVLEAVDDDFSATVIHHGDGGIAGDVTANDFMNGTAVNDADVVITVIDNGGLTGVTIDANGNLIVPATATPGTYIITYSICDVVNAANCSQATAIVVVVPSLRVDNFNMASIDIYPNPAVKEVFITIPDTAGLKDVKVIVFDLKGREILNQPIIGNTQKIDISALEQGVYIFNITSNRGTVTKRIVKEK